MGIQAGLLELRRSILRHEAHADRLPGLRDRVRSGRQQQAAPLADRGEGAGCRRGAAAATVVVLEPDEVETDDEIAVADDEAEEESEAESAIEDVSELGDDDMSDVIDTELDEDEGER